MRRNGTFDEKKAVVHPKVHKGLGSPEARQARSGADRVGLYTGTKQHSALGRHTWLTDIFSVRMCLVHNISVYGQVINTDKRIQGNNDKRI